ncbi:MAG: response regulator transcription factor [Actinomycetota bacterium]
MDTELRVIVVSQGSALTQSLILLLTRRFAVRVLGPVADEVRALEVLAGGSVGLIVVDLAREDGRAAEIVSAMVDGCATPVLAVAADGSVEDPARALAAGAIGVIRGTGGNAHELAASLRRAATGALVLPDVDLPSVVEQLRERSGMPLASAGLTAREEEVLRAMSTGTSAEEIARALGISTQTVRSHVKNVMAKLGVHSKVEAVTFALRTGLTGDRRSA